MIGWPGERNIYLTHVSYGQSTRKGLTNVWDFPHCCIHETLVYLCLHTILTIHIYFTLHSLNVDRTSSKLTSYQIASENEWKGFSKCWRKQCRWRGKPCRHRCCSLSTYAVFQSYASLGSNLAIMDLCISEHGQLGKGRALLCHRPVFLRAASHSERQWFSLPRQPCWSESSIHKCAVSEQRGIQCLIQLNTVNEKRFGCISYA